jgi:hypothetical protein
MSIASTLLIVNSGELSIETLTSVSALASIPADGGKGALAIQTKPHFSIRSLSFVKTWSFLGLS